MRISEIYTAYQGEGYFLGEPMPFIRTAGCNLSCSWCDSRYTWEPGYSYTEMSPLQILEHVQALPRTPRRWVSLTGGEPTIQRDAEALVTLLKDHDYFTLVETNGLLSPDWFEKRSVFVSCSPKLPGSGQDTPARRKKIARLVEARQRTQVTRAMTQWKFVIATDEDLDLLPAYCESVGITVGHAETYIYLQPDGYVQPVERYLERLAWLQRSAPPWALVTPQVHRLVHGPDARGV